MQNLQQEEPIQHGKPVAEAAPKGIIINVCRYHAIGLYLSNINMIIR
jgi:hypothetical protein